MIYPLNETIEKLLESAVDEETGEVLLTDEELAEKIAAAELEFDEMIKALRNSYMTDMIDSKCIAAEASELWKLQQETSKRAKAKENRAERTKRYLAYLLKGEKYEKDGIKIGYINRKETVIDDGFVDWAIHYAPALLNEPTVKKNALTQALKTSGGIEFAHLEDKKYIVVR